jgi:hypothetical protein
MTDKWQPIATVPTDGTHFLAAIKVHSARGTGPARQWWEMHVIAIDPDDGFIPPDLDQGWDFRDYSHWMPLPKPPEEQ